MSQEPSAETVYHSEVPFWRDIRVLRILTQLAFVIVVLIAGFWLVNNLLNNLNELGLDLKFNFLNLEAGFLVSEGPRFEASDSFGRAFVVGLLNTLRVAALGVVLTTILGLIVGVALLSNNFLIRTIASTYVEIMRNTPLLVQLFFLYFAIILQLPRVKEHLSLGSVMISNRGIAMPWPKPTASWTPWLISLAFGLVVGTVLWIWRAQSAKRLGRPPFSLLWIVLVFLVIAVIGWLFVPGQPFLITTPELEGFKIVGGMTLTPEFAALLIGLVVYTAAFVADIVRSGILSVSKGQVEAAHALGLSSYQSLRLIILPQAIRVVIPPLINQYLNLTKNSSLAIAIGYPDLYALSSTILNQSGKVVQIIILMMAVYLSISLSISVVMNMVNRRMQIVER